MTTHFLSSVNPSNYQWLFRYKLHHLPFWFGYHFMWWTLRIGSPLDVLASLALPHAATKFVFFLVFQMAGVYFNLYFLVPRFLEKGKYLWYVCLLLLTIVATAVCITTGYYVGAFIAAKPFKELFGTDPDNFFTLFESGALPSTAAAITLGMSVKLTKNWLQTKRKEQVLEKEKLETELKFLRSQFNPHFLFNTINSIFVLIHKNPHMASESLAKFSELLRYQLYECNEHQIPVSQELGYLANFIGLEKLRQDATIELQFEITPPATDCLMIAPFILMPFIENAFKHVSQQPAHHNWIRMSLDFEQTQLRLTIANSISSQHPAASALVVYQGIGLKNVRRRLDLLYPDKHELHIHKDTDQFEVRLLLYLSAQSVESFQPALVS